MKSVMKKLITIKNISVLALVLLVVLGPSLVKVTAQDPDPVYLSDDAVINSIVGKLHAKITFYSVEDDIAAIREVLNQYAVTTNAGDFEGWLALHADDVAKMPPDAPAIFGMEDLRANFAPGFDAFDLSCVIYPEETQVDGDMGYERGTYSISATPKGGGEAINLMKDGKYLTICKRQTDGSWKISQDCYNSNIPPAQ